MDWAKYKNDWPHAEASRFVLSKPHKWHVQEMGEGPLLLLLHGAGGSTQSFRHLMPLLAESFRVIAIDLPGQGFTKLGAQSRCGLEPMTQDIARLCAQEGWHPHAIIGHSAGVAIAFELAERSTPPAPRVIGINGALSNFKGVAGLMFPLMAKALSIMPGVAGLFTASNRSPQSVRRLIEGTGSNLSEDDLRFYGALVSDRGHVNATLQMMAQWDLNPLLSRIPQSNVEGLLISASGDRAVPAATSQKIAGLAAGLDHIGIPDLGHLVHEEAPDTVAQIVLAYLAKNAPN